MNIREPSRLSALQSLMHEWSLLVPYNFIHAMRFERPQDVTRWQNAVATAMWELSISPRSITVEQPAVDLDTHLETELHRPFSSGAPPFRFFVINDKDGSHWFGAVVDHWAADDFSCRALLQRIDADNHGDTAPTLIVPVEPPLTRLGFREWGLYLKEAKRMRRACRTALHDPTDFRVRIFRRVLSKDVLDATRTLARQRGATVNDVLLAAAAQSFSANRESPAGDKRDAVAIVSAMDLRRFEPEPAQTRLGLLISHFAVMVQRPHKISLPALVEEIAIQTREFKSRPGTEIIGPTLLLFRLSWSRRAKATFFVRGAPYVAGFSNVNLTGTWIENTEVTDYRRIGPTGPVVPMVLMITTFRGSTSIDVTFRTTAFTPAQAEHLIDDMIRRLARLGRSQV